jgi:hypothetical protein
MDVAVENRTRSGWVTLSAVLILMAGGYNAIWGYGALGKKELFHEASLIYSNLEFWGWVFLIIGVLQILTAFLLFTRHPMGVILAAVGATTSAFIAFFSVLSNPTWSLAIIGLDLLVLWTVFAHVDDFE